MSRLFSPSRAGSRAFTLLELIVVIVILGVLAAIAIPTFQAVTQKSRLASVVETTQSFDRSLRAAATLSQSSPAATLPSLPASDNPASWTPLQGSLDSRKVVLSRTDGAWSCLYLSPLASSPSLLTASGLSSPPPADACSTTTSSPAIGSGGNLVPNSSFEQPVSGVYGYPSNANWSVSTAQAYDGTHSLLLSPAGISSGTYGAYAPNLPVTAGHTYTASFYVRAASQAGPVQVVLEWHHADGSFASTPTVAQTQTDSSSGWTRITVTGAAPSDAVTAVLCSYVNYASGDTGHYVDAFQLQDAASASAYTPGPNS